VNSRPVVCAAAGDRTVSDPNIDTESNNRIVMILGDGVINDKCNSEIINLLPIWCETVIMGNRNPLMSLITIIKVPLLNDATGSALVSVGVRGL
jgi:hypothetical protein